MMSTTAGKPIALSETQHVSRKAGNFVTRKIWLPKLLYNVLPYFYLISGFAAFAATLYINEWFWVVPHYCLFSVACIHMGILIHRRRHAPSSSESSSELS